MAQQRPILHQPEHGVPRCFAFFLPKVTCLRRTGKRLPSAAPALEEAGAIGLKVMPSRPPRSFPTSRNCAGDSCVKYAVITAGLLCATPAAMAQNAAVPQPKPVALVASRRPAAGQAAAAARRAAAGICAAAGGLCLISAKRRRRGASRAGGAFGLSGEPGQSRGIPAASRPGRSGRLRRRRCRGNECHHACPIRAKSR